MSLLLLAAGPVSASPMPPEFGSGVKCKYTVTEYTDGAWTKAELRMIGVFPPVMYATEVGNQVGWRFVVTRSTENGPYKKIVKSGIQKRIPLNMEADFDVMHYRVELPEVAHPDLVRYRVTIVMFHYNSDRSINSTERQLLSSHMTTFDGYKDHQHLDYCEGTAQQEV